MKTPAAQSHQNKRGQKKAAAWGGQIKGALLRISITVGFANQRSHCLVLHVCPGLAELHQTLIQSDPDTQLNVSAPAPLYSEANCLMHWCDGGLVVCVVTGGTLVFLL